MIESANTTALHTFDDFLARLTGSGRASVDRHLAACEKELTFEHIRLWKRLAAFLAGLTPDSTPVASARAIQFYVIDGKYKMQVFALEDLRDGNLAIYSKDAREAAVREGVLTTRTDFPTHHYSVGPGGSQRGEPLKIEPLTTAGTNSAPDYYKHMLGWNRTAIRTTLPRNPTAIQLRAAEAVFVLAAQSVAPASRPPATAPAQS